MGNGLHLAVVKMKGALKKRFAVAGGAASRDDNVLRQLVVELCDGADRRLDRGTVIIRIEGIQKLPVLSDEGELGCCGAGVDSEISLSFVGFQVSGSDAVLIMPLQEFVVFRLRSEQGLHPADLEFHMNIAGELIQHILHHKGGRAGACLLRMGRVFAGLLGQNPVPCAERRADCGEKM